MNVTPVCMYIHVQCTYIMYCMYACMYVLHMYIYYVCAHLCMYLCTYVCTFAPHSHPREYIYDLYCGGATKTSNGKLY